ncbi:MAG: GNAT family N-acetyltransferase [Bacteroidota bacterium]|nr:GNAT family N-acetyltransferase [Bacteroidota bacterium]
MNALKFIEVTGKNKLIARQLLTEYGHYLFDELKLMAGHESFFAELKKFPEDKYKPPGGAFFIVYSGKAPIGCVGLKKWDNESCELKRMYIREEFRGKGYARTVIKIMTEQARQLGYTRMLLDTHAKMEAAVTAYRKAGFVEIPQYCENENADPLFFSLSF